MTEKEIDLFADADNKAEEITAPLNEKMYQVVDLKNGTYQFKRYNGSKSEQRYTSLGYFKLGTKLVRDSFKNDEVNKRKIDGNKTIRRARSDVLTKLHDAVKMLDSKYDFYPAAKDLLNDAEMQLAQKYVDELNKKYKTEKMIAELQAVKVIVRDLTVLTHPHKELTPEEQQLYDDVKLYVKSLGYNVEKDSVYNKVINKG